MLRMWFSW